MLKIQQFVRKQRKNRNQTHKKMNMNGNITNQRNNLTGNQVVVVVYGLARASKCSYAITVT